MSSETGTVSAQKTKKTLFCVECEDVPAAVICEGCHGEAYCGLCFRYLHKKGFRAKHKYHVLSGVKLHDHIEPNRSGLDSSNSNSNSSTICIATDAGDVTMTNIDDEDDSGSMNVEHNLTEILNNKSPNNINNNEDEEENISNNGIDADGDTKMSTCRRGSGGEEEIIAVVGTAYPKEVTSEAKESARWVPLRVTSEERVLLNMLEGLLEVSQYTDHVDVSFDYYGWRTSGGGKKQGIIDKELRMVLNLVCGLCVAGDYAHNAEVIQRTLAENEGFYQRVFEVGRRFKILNPGKMRTTYGKLMHILQDYRFNATIIKKHEIIPIRTVLDLLKKKGAVLLLADPDLPDAIRTINGSHKSKKDDSDSDDVEIEEEEEEEKDTIKEQCDKKSCKCSSSSDDNSSSNERAAVNALIARKRQLQEQLSLKYSSQCLKGSKATVEDIQLCLDSLSDADAYLVSNRDPVEKTLGLLEEMFPATKPNDKNEDLSISVGVGGSCLSHTHSQQYEFVRQSLLLWREIQSQMFRLWILADTDLLEAGGPYRLCSNGQGLNRLQSAPNVGKAMSQILSKVQRSISRGWLGLSVVHLGDRDVPNALFFHRQVLAGAEDPRAPGLGDREARHPR